MTVADGDAWEYPPVRSMDHRHEALRLLVLLVQRVVAEAMADGRWWRE